MSPHHLESATNFHSTRSHLQESEAGTGMELYARAPRAGRSMIKNGKRWCLVLGWKRALRRDEWLYSTKICEPGFHLVDRSSRRRLVQVFQSRRGGGGSRSIGSPPAATRRSCLTRISSTEDKSGCFVLVIAGDARHCQVVVVDLVERIGGVGSVEQDAMSCQHHHNKIRQSRATVRQFHVARPKSSGGGSQAPRGSTMELIQPRGALVASTAVVHVALKREYVKPRTPRPKTLSALSDSERTACGVEA
ncbi:hypothetical protein ON010_g2582 [Phytophthora cinnamomi]|nr:hypothetical protein ON010_g2582 [Phytophthora cinnamomi]